MFREVDQRIKAWSIGYTGILSSLDQTVEEMSGNPCASLRKRIVDMRDRLTPAATPAVIEEQSAIVQKTVEEIAQGLKESRLMREREFKKIVRVTAEAGAAMIRSGNTHADEITQFATRIESASCFENVVEIRREMADRVAELNEVASRIQADSKKHAAALNEQIQKIQERLVLAESLADTDALTGLGNRRLLERRMASAIEAKSKFCVGIFDLNGFKAVNDEFGHPEGDRLLKAVGHSLSGLVRGTDTVGRWGGDEFVVILRGIGLSGATARIAEIQNKAFGDFVLEHNGRTVRVPVQAYVGIAEHAAGESGDDVFERADQELYAKKRARYAGHNQPTLGLTNMQAVLGPAHTGPTVRVS